MKNRMLKLLAAFAALLPAASGAVPAFPGAEGYGAVTPGGRGGRVIMVTNTNASGAGSLMAAMMTAGPRTIVFRTSGVINLGSSEIILEPATLAYLTVAGQTSPGGITLTSNSGTPINSGYTACRWHDGIFRFMRMRVVRLTGGNGGDHATNFYQAKTFIFDHCDFSGGDDENLDFMYTGDFTVQWSTICNSGPGGQVYGFLMNGTQAAFPQKNISLHHNLFANHVKRAPEIHWGYGATTVPDSGRFDFRSNITYNINIYGVYFSVVPSLLTANLVGNYFKTGPVTDADYTPPVAPATNMSIYIKDNYWDSPGKTSSTALAITSRLDPDTILRTQYASPTIVSTPWNFAPVTTTPAFVTYDTVLKRVGAWPRDSMNSRTVKEVRTKTGGLSEYGEPYLTATPAAPADADMDGMPDFWETAMGFNPNDSAGKNADHDGDGYTNVEEYLNDLANARLCLDYFNPPYPIPSNWPDYSPGCCKSLALEEANNPAGKVPKLCVSPNPWQGGALAVKSPFNRGRISIIDINGREAARAETRGTLTFDRAAFSPGLYLVRFSADDGKVFAKKLVVIK